MKKYIIALIFLMLAVGPANLLAAGGHNQHSSSGSVSQGATKKAFNHQDTVEGVRVEFQVMSLEQMGMQDPGGATHHVMAKFIDDKTSSQIKTAAGRIKVIDPNGKEQIGDLKNYEGVLAANFTFDSKGQYGIICLFKIDEKKRLVKFWYPHS